MESRPQPSQPSAEQQRVIDHGEGPLLVVGPAGSGRTQALAARMARIAAEPGQNASVVTATQAAAAAVRARTEELLPGSHDELRIGPLPRVAERLLRDYALEAGIDPFFEVVNAPARLAMLLDRIDDLPLRRHQIRGNPAGLLARLIQRIDLLKAEAISPQQLRDWAGARERASADTGEREMALRESEFAALYDRHDEILRHSGSLDDSDVIRLLSGLLESRADIRAHTAEKLGMVMADEVEEYPTAAITLLLAMVPHGNLIATLDPDQAVRRFRAPAGSNLARLREQLPDSELIQLDGFLRGSESMRVAAAAVAGLGSPGSDGPSEPGSETAPDAPPLAGAKPPRNDDSVRLWECENERAQAQAVAAEVEHLLAVGEVQPGDVCVLTGAAASGGRLAAAALEERSVPFRTAGATAFFGRPEVRDALAWLRALADPNDAAAVVRALTRPPIGLRSVDLARCTTIARRRKLDMISAIEAALESPQLPPESRDRIRAFLKLFRSAGAALERMRADVFVRRLIERIGLRRQNLFAASPETAERLVNLSRLAELAAEWQRREPRGSTRDFVAYLAALAEAGERFDELVAEPSMSAVLLAEPGQVKALEFKRVYVLGLHRGGIRCDAARESWIPEELVSEDLGDAPDEAEDSLRRRLVYLGMSRACSALVLSRPLNDSDGRTSPSPMYEAVRAALGVVPEEKSEELFGPAEGLHATYRMLRDEVLESSWRAGAALSEMRLDTAADLNQAVVRYLELLKLAALIQRPGSEPPSEALGALNDLIMDSATPEQSKLLAESSLDALVLGEQRDGEARRDLINARGEPGLEAFIPGKGTGRALSASDVDLYRTCPLKYKFARVFAIPQEPTINQRFGILVHNVLQRYHSEELRGGGDGGGSAPSPAPSLDRLLNLFEGGWQRTGFGSTDDELQYRDRAVAALARYHERHASSDSRPVMLERGFSFQIGEHRVRGRVDRVDKTADGGFEVIDYKTGAAKSEADLADDVQLPLYRMAARNAWEVDADSGAYWYVLDDAKVSVSSAADDLERVERTVLEVAEGISSQDFEPRPDYEICSWCDYRLICPAAEV